MSTFAHFCPLFSTFSPLFAHFLPTFRRPVALLGRSSPALFCAADNCPSRGPRRRTVADNCLSPATVLPNFCGATGPEFGCPSAQLRRPVRANSLHTCASLAALQLRWAAHCPWLALENMQTVCVEWRFSSKKSAPFCAGQKAKKHRDIVHCAPMTNAGRA